MPSFRDFFLLYNGSGLYFGLYFSALIYIVAKGDRREKIVFLTTPLLLLVLGFNPLSLSLVNRIFGESDTLYRLFWIFPVGILLAYCAAKLVGEQTTKKKSIAVGMACFMTIALSGLFIVQRIPDAWAATPMKVAPQLIEIVEIMNEDKAEDEELVNEQICVAVSPEFILDIRPYDASILLAYSQDQLIGRYNYFDNVENMEILLDLFTRNIPHEQAVVERVLQEEEVDYIVCPQAYAAVGVLEAIDTELLGTVDGFAVYKYNG